MKGKKLGASVAEIARFLDEELRVRDFRDYSNNGLQVENSGRAGVVSCGVDASLQFFEAARRRGARLLICHHGLSWGDSLKRITELNYRRLSFLIRNDMALYACHLPLDAHPRHGNNAGIARALGLRRLKGFGRLDGRDIGFEGVLPRPLPLDRFKDLVRKAVSPKLSCMDFGPRRIRRVAVVSGSAADETMEAGRRGVDAYITGEPKLLAHDLAREYGVNVLFAGHYATEVFGVRALGELLQRRFGVQAEFIDLKVPY